MQLSLNCSAQASQLIQSGPSRDGTKPELINLPKPIWVLQWFLGAYSALSHAPDWAVLFAWVQCSAPAGSTCPYDAATPFNETLPNPKALGSRQRHPVSSEGISKDAAGLISTAQTEYRCPGPDPASLSAKLPLAGRQCSAVQAGLGSSIATSPWHGVWRSRPRQAELVQHPQLSKYQTCINHWRTERPQQSGNDFRMG